MKLDSSGFTLTELVISLGLGSVAMLAFMTVEGIEVSASRRVLATESRDALVDLIKRQVSYRGLQSSALHSENSQLATCFNGVFCKSLEENPLVLYSSNGNPDPVSGTPDAPRLYSANGSPCMVGAAPSTRCSLQVYTTYRAQCAPNFSISLQPNLTCTSPEIIEVFYNIQPALLSAQSQLTNSSNDVTVSSFKPVQGSVIVAISGVL